MKASADTPGIVEKRRRTNFTIVNNEVIDDDDLTPEAYMLYCIMMRLPDNWDFRMSWIYGQRGCGRERWDSAMQRLRSLGYVHRTEERLQNGQLRVRWVVFEDRAQPDPTVAEVLAKKQRRTERKLAKRRVTTAGHPTAVTTAGQPTAGDPTANNTVGKEEHTQTLSEKGLNAFPAPTPGPLRAPLADGTPDGEPIPPLSPEPIAQSPEKEEAETLGTKSATWRLDDPQNHQGNVHLKWFVGSAFADQMLELFPGVTLVPSATAKMLRRRIQDALWNHNHFHFLRYCWDAKRRSTFTDFRQVINTLEAIAREPAYRYQGQYTNAMMEEIGLIADEEDLRAASKQTWQMLRECEAE